MSKQMTIADEAVESVVDVVAPEPAELPDVLSIMKQVLEYEGGVGSIERLAALQERIMEQRREQALVYALNQFHHLCPEILKTKAGGSFLVDEDGVKVKRQWFYAPLDSIVRQIRPYLHRFGLSYSWDTEAGETWIEIVCTLRHVDGGSRTSRHRVPIMSNPKNSGAQNWGGTASFGKRLTLSNVLGITTHDDVDGADIESEGEVITWEQVAELTALAAEVLVDTPEKSTSERIAMWLAFLGVGAIVDLPASKFEQAKASLESKRERS